MELTEGEIRKAIVVDSPVEVVFKALTDEKELVNWMPSETRMDARVGGEYEFRYHWEDRGIDSTVRGRILELVPNKKLSYTWATPSSIVTWTLEELPDGKARVTLTHSGFSKDRKQETEGGWAHFLGRLANYCKKQE